MVKLTTVSQIHLESILALWKGHSVKILHVERNTTLISLSGPRKENSTQNVRCKLLLLTESLNVLTGPIHDESELFFKGQSYKRHLDFRNVYISLTCFRCVSIKLVFCYNLEGSNAPSSKLRQIFILFKDYSYFIRLPPPI